MKSARRSGSKSGFWRSPRTSAKRASGFTTGGSLSQATRTTSCTTGTCILKTCSFRTSAAPISAAITSRCSSTSSTNPALSRARWASATRSRATTLSPCSRRRRCSAAGRRGTAAGSTANITKSSKNTSITGFGTATAIRTACVSGMAPTTAAWTIRRCASATTA